MDRRARRIIGLLLAIVIGLGLAVLIIAGDDSSDTTTVTVTTTPSTTERSTTTEPPPTTTGPSGGTSVPDPRTETLQEGGQGGL